MFQGRAEPSNLFLNFHLPYMPRKNERTVLFQGYAFPRPCLLIDSWNRKWDIQERRYPGLKLGDGRR